MKKIYQIFFFMVLVVFLSCTNKSDKNFESKPYYDSIEVNDPISTHRYGGHPNGCNEF